MAVCHGRAGVFLGGRRETALDSQTLGGIRARLIVLLQAATLVPEATAGDAKRRDGRAWELGAAWLRPREGEEGPEPEPSERAWTALVAAALGVGGLFDVCTMVRRDATLTRAPAPVESQTCTAVDRSAPR